MKKEDRRSIFKVLALSCVIILIIICMFTCHVVRHYSDSVNLSIVPTVPSTDTVTYNLESEFTFDVEAEKLSYRFSIFPCDTIVVKDTINFKYGDVKKKFAIADFRNISDTLRYEGWIECKDIASWSAYKVVNTGVSVNNFTLHRFDCCMRLRYSYPFTWLCNNLYSPDIVSINHTPYNTSVTCAGDRDVEIHLFLENPKKVLLNTFWVVLLSTLLGYFISKLLDELIS